MGRLTKPTRRAALSALREYNEERYSKSLRLVRGADYLLKRFPRLTVTYRNRLTVAGQDTDHHWNMLLHELRFKYKGEESRVNAEILNVNTMMRLGWLDKYD